MGAQCKETPKSARRRLRELAKLFVFTESESESEKKKKCEEGVPAYAYDAKRAQKILKDGTTRETRSAWWRNRKQKKLHKKKVRRLFKRQVKMRKLKKLGIKKATTQSRFSKRAARLVM